MCRKYVIYYVDNVILSSTKWDNQLTGLALTESGLRD